MDPSSKGKRNECICRDIGDLLEKLLEDDIIPEILTDQTSAHDPVFGYVPNGMSLSDAPCLRKNDQVKYCLLYTSPSPRD